MSTRTITISLKKLKADYEKAVTSREPEFETQDITLVTAYGKYLIQYLEGKVVTLQHGDVFEVLVPEELAE